MNKEKIICVGCPMGCETTLQVDARGKVIKIEGYKCKEGRQFVLEEYKNPVRVFTTTLLTEDTSRALLPVRSNRPILKTKMKEAVKALAHLRVKPPIKGGQVIFTNLLNTGADIIASDDLIE